MMDDLEQLIWKCTLELQATHDEILVGVMGTTPDAVDKMCFNEAFAALRRMGMIVPTICDEHGQRYTAVSRRLYDNRIILWDGDGWYNFDIPTKRWMKVYMICHSDRREMRFIMGADCFDM